MNEADAAARLGLEAGDAALVLLLSFISGTVRRKERRLGQSGGGYGLPSCRSGEAFDRGEGPPRWVPSGRENKTDEPVRMAISMYYGIW